MHPTHLSILLLTAISALKADPNCRQKGTFCLFISDRNEFSFADVPTSWQLAFSLIGRQLKNSRHEWNARLHQDCKNITVDVQFFKKRNDTTKLRFEFIASKRLQNSLYWDHYDGASIRNETRTALRETWYKVKTVAAECELKIESTEKVSSIFELNRKRQRVMVRMRRDDKMQEIESKMSFLLFAEDENRQLKPKPWFRRSTIVLTSLMSTIFLLFMALLIVDFFIITQEFT